MRNILSSRRALAVVTLLLTAIPSMAVDRTSNRVAQGQAERSTPPVQACAALLPNGQKFVTGQHLASVPALDRPATGQVQLDPVYGTCIARLTDHERDLGIGAGGHARHDYARRQAFNADSSKIIVSGSNGTWHLYDGSTLQHLQKLPGLGGDAEPQWHPSKPEILRFVPNNGVGMRLLELDLRDGRTRVLGDFAARLRARWPDASTAWTKSEGSPSADGRTWCFMVDSSKWQGLGVFTWDLDSDQILGMLDLEGRRPDHVSMSPSGKHCVVSGDAVGGTVAYRHDLTGPARRLHVKSEHSDLAMNEQGNDVYVSIDYQARGGPVFMVDLSTGRRTDLFNTYLAGTATAIHFSGKAYNKPGWIVASTYAEYAGRGNYTPQWLHKKVFSFSLKNNPDIVNIAHPRSVHAGYFSEPQATVNRDMTRILFNSNWGQRVESESEVYLLMFTATPTW